MKCTRCRKDFGGLFTALATADLMRGVLCPDCEALARRERADQVAAEERLAEEKRRRAAEARAEEDRRLAAVILTTTPAIDGRRVTDYLGIEAVEIVIGTGVFSELSGELSDFLGQRSKAFEKKLGQAKELAFRTLRARAIERGADAVVAVDLDYTEFSGNRVALIASGTLVSLAPEVSGFYRGESVSALPPFLR